MILFKFRAIVVQINFCFVPYVLQKIRSNRMMATLDNPDPLLSINRAELNDDEEDDCAASPLAEEIFGKQINTALNTALLTLLLL